MEHIKTTPITRVKSITKEDFIKYYHKLQCPVLIESLIIDWSAYKNIT
ncbi:MAG: hypothetical protein HN440_01190 [Flavobacteriaceae bacterium]|jgi:hypothetical protein|nr:hypothetical protein [Flavobacteriaceae bacterium]MBT6689396.1 hypothetical protein [Flavobacteriaceae bacterium]